MLRKSAISLVGLPWDIYWVLWAKLIILLVRDSLDLMVTKHIAYNEIFGHLQNGLCTCQ